jgi:hypothetical protein
MCRKWGVIIHITIQTKMCEATSLLYYRGKHNIEMLLSQMLLLQMLLSQMLLLQMLLLYDEAPHRTAAPRGWHIPTQSQV